MERKERNEEKGDSMDETETIVIYKQLVQEKQTMDRMTDTLSKRGPDDSNVWGEHHVLFGHKRLAVVDIEGGRQPMACTYKGSFMSE